VKVLVCGGRAFDDARLLDKKLTAVHAKHQVTAIIHGAARGADLLAEAWAKKNEIPYHGVPAEWTRYGKAAGYRRNADMLLFEPDVVIAFAGGKGTAMMCDIARRANIKVWEIDSLPVLPS
jgi:hypothetical protein